MFIRLFPISGNVYAHDGTKYLSKVVTYMKTAQLEQALHALADSNSTFEVMGPDTLEPEGFVETIIWETICHAWTNGGDPTRIPTVLKSKQGTVKIISDADIDCDGSPRALAIDPGNGQLGTSLSQANGWKGHDNFVNSEEMPYFVLPINFEAITGIKVSLGDVAKIAYKDKHVFAIYADVGPQKLLGEVSITTAVTLGCNPWNADYTKVVRGIPHGVEYIIIPQSKNLAVCTTFDSIQAYGKQLFGIEVVTTTPTQPKTPPPAFLWIPHATRYKSQMPTRGTYRKHYPEFALIHFTAGSDSDVIGFGIESGYTYLHINRAGLLTQASPLDSWGYHAGASSKDGYGTSISQYCVGIEITSAGKVEEIIVDGVHRYKAWFHKSTSQYFHAKEVRYSSTCSDQGWYHCFTKEQEATLIKTLVWLYKNNPTIFKIEDTDFHENVAPGRKNDPGASLSMSLKELIATVKSHV